MRDLKKEFENRKIIFNKLLEYGFRKENDVYIYEKTLSNNQFKVCIYITKKEQKSKIIDMSFNEEFLLVDINKRHGDFVASLNEEYESILNDMMKNCSIIEQFKTKQAKLIIKYIKEKFNDKEEYIFKKFPSIAILRNKINSSWYLIIMKIKKSKLGFDSDELIEIIDLRYQKNEIDKIIDSKLILKGYHMNKNNWITIILDKGVNISKIYNLIDNSYNLSIKK